MKETKVNKYGNSKNKKCKQVANGWKGAEPVCGRNEGEGSPLMESLHRVID